VAVDWALLAQFAQDWGKPLAQILGGPTAGAIAGWFLGRKRQQATSFADQTNAITKRFQVLLDGYEKRINDLVAEIDRLKGMIKELQAELASKQPPTLGL